MYRLSDSIRTTHHSEGGAVLDIEHGRMFALNTVGSRILELLKEDLKEPEIIMRIASEFGGDLEITASDAKEFIERLKEHQVIEERPA
jgi:hypothetical protein